MRTCEQYTYEQLKTLQKYSRIDGTYRRLKTITVLLKLTLLVGEFQAFIIRSQKNDERVQSGGFMMLIQFTLTSASTTTRTQAIL